ncbi:MAG: DUF3830 family protein [Chloroflexi bacterium]|nr:DUF3830 family protein [Chloroflexota bacterium]
MARRLLVRMGQERGVIEMLEDKAPRTCEHVWRNLPISSFGIHAKFAGCELIIMVPYYLDTDENMNESVVGDVAYYPGRQTICMWYGPAAALGKAPTFGRIVEGIDALRGAAERILREGSLPASITRLEDNASYAVSPSLEPQAGQPQVRSYITFLKKFVNDTWDNEPDDLRRLREHSRPPMGNLPCMLYANFDLFWAGENLQVCREMAKNRSLPLDSLNKMAGALLRRASGRLRLLQKWSVSNTPEAIDDVAAFLDGEGVSNYADFITLMEYVILATGRMANWVDRAIPWADLDASLALHR